MRIAPKWLRLLFALELLSKRPKGRKVSLDDGTVRKLDMIYSISEGRLFGYLSLLREKGLLKGGKRRSNGAIELTVTGKGIVALKEMEIRTKVMVLDAVRNNIPETTSLHELLTRLEDPFEKMMLIELLEQSEELDISNVLSTIRGNHLTNLENLMITSMEEEAQADRFPLDLILYDTTFYGPSKKRRGSRYVKEIRSLLYMASARSKSRDPLSAKDIYLLILGKKGSSENERLLCRVGLAQLERIIGNEELALQMLDGLRGSGNSRIENAFIEMKMAEMLIGTTDEHEGLKMMRGAMNVFNTEGKRTLEAICHVHLGIHFFRKERYKDSEFHFNRALELSRYPPCPYLQAYAQINLADIHILRSELDKAKRYLSSARRFFKDLNDMYGLAGTYFNWSLYFIAKGEPERAYEELIRSLNIAYPLPNPRLRQEWKDVFRKRMQDAGFESSSKHL